MPFVWYSPNPARLARLKEADGSARLNAATTNVSLEQLADGIAYLNDRTSLSSAVMTDARDTQPYRHTFSRPWYERPDPDIVTTVQDVRAGDELQLSFQAAATLTGNGYGLLTFWIRAITPDGRFPIDNRWGTVRVPGPTQIGMSLRWPMTLAWFHGPVEVGIRGRAEDARMTLYGPLHLSANRVRV